MRRPGAKLPGGADEFAGALDQENPSEEKEKRNPDPDRGRNHPPENDQNRDRHESDARCSKPVRHAIRYAVHHSSLSRVPAPWLSDQQ